MKGIIYKITCNETGEVYYGSTQQSLNVRMQKHKSKCKAWKEGRYCYTTSFRIIERGNYSYSLIETVECDEKKQLETRERYYIEHNDCVNKCIPMRSKKEWREENKNKEKERQYREANKDAINEKQRQRYEANKDYINERKKEWRAHRKELGLRVT
jgi:hypothetical protein